MTTDPIQPTDDSDVDVEHVDLEGSDDRRRGVGRRGAFAAAAGGLAAAATAAVAATSGSAPRAEVTSAGAPSSRATKQQPSRNKPAKQQAPAKQRARKQPTPADAMIGTVAASLEQLAVNTYGAALDAAGAGALGEVPPAVAEFVTVARDQHQAALDAWNQALTGAGAAAVNAPPAELEASVNEQFGMVTDVAGAAQLALMLEQVAAATYLDALGKLESPEAIELAGSIQPVARQHISVLLFVLGMYPVPEVFASTDMAFAGGPLAVPTMPATR